MYINDPIRVIDIAFLRQFSGQTAARMKLGAHGTVKDQELLAELV
jgi:hypothetical protein